MSIEGCQITLCVQWGQGQTIDVVHPRLPRVLVLMEASDQRVCQGPLVCTGMIFIKTPKSAKFPKSAKSPDNILQIDLL